MKNLRRTMSLASVLVMAALSSSHAASLPTYPGAGDGFSSQGTINTATYDFTVQSTGVVTAYYAGSKANFADTLFLLNNDVIVGSVTGATPTGASGSIPVNAGDKLSFALLTNEPDAQGNPYVFFSNPAFNQDGVQHIYSTIVSYAAGDNPGGIALPAGTYTYVGFEDISENDPHTFFRDRDYNDQSFLFTNIAVSSVPLPASLPMFGAAILVLAGLGYRKSLQGSPKASVAAN